MARSSTSAQPARRKKLACGHAATKASHRAISSLRSRLMCRPAKEEAVSNIMSSVRRRRGRQKRHNPSGPSENRRAAGTGGAPYTQKKQRNKNTTKNQNPTNTTTQRQSPT